jgi:nucleotide-binding universal stress UspA family protein
MAIAHILVTSDLSPEAIRPCAPVASMARALGARITLLHVIQSAPPSMAVSGERLSVPEDVQARIILARTQLELQSDALAGADLTVEVVTGFEVVETVLDYVASNKVDMIAMAKHDRSGLQRLVLGSVAEAIIRRSTVPVLVFPRPAGGANRGR